jgi:hypothetical protein
VVGSGGEGKEKMSAKDEEPFNISFRYKVIVDTIRGIANGELILVTVPRGWDKETTDNINNSINILDKGTEVFTDPRSTDADREGIELAMFKAILVLKVSEVLKPTLNRDKLQTDIARIDLKQDALSVLMKDILTVLTGLTDMVEEALKK